MPGSRLDPALLLALDEVTQICPVPVPSWLADSGGKGVQIITVAHGEAQLRSRWGADGARVIMDTSGVKMWLPGISDPDAELAGHPGEDNGPYDPAPAPAWWRIAGTERDTAVARLRAWADQVYRPGYGHLAAGLPACWEHHPLCLYTLDWLSELWAALYLDPHRAASTLAGQSEWQARLLPAAATQMARDTTGCQHGSASKHRSDSPGPPVPRPRQ